MATIKEIARLTGLSVGTVSNVINDVNTVSEKNGIKILETIKNFDYIPNRIARSLSKKSTKNVAFIITDITNPFFPEIVRGAQDLLAKKGYYVFLCNSDNDPEMVNFLVGNGHNMRWQERCLIKLEGLTPSLRAMILS